MKKKNTLLLFLCLFSLWAVAQEKKPVKIACVGNSITYGSGIKNQFQNSYPGVLSQLLGEGYDVRNFGSFVIFWHFSRISLPLNWERMTVNPGIGVMEKILRRI